MISYWSNTTDDNCSDAFCSFNKVYISVLNYLSTSTEKVEIIHKVTFGNLWIVIKKPTPHE